MKPVSQMSMEELAAYVCSKLGENNIETVLSGGSYVQIYSQGKYYFIINLIFSKT